MSDTEKQFENFVRTIRFDDKPNLQHREEIEKDLLQALSQKQSPRSEKMWRIIMKSQTTKFAAAAIIILAVALMVFVLDRTTTPAWAIEQTIEAVKNFRAVHVVGSFAGGTAEIWMRANEAGTKSCDVIAKLNHGAIAWVKDGSTYYYEPSQNTVYFENAITIGLSQWLGPELLEMLSKADGAEVMRGNDPATGRERATLVCSLLDNNGPQSWIIEFDVETKLPVSFKSWRNMDMSGVPEFHAFNITYYKKMADRLFEVHIPGNPTYVEKPLTIPDENIGILSNPDKGISAEGLTQQQACEKILRENYMAIIEGDIDKIKKLCPLSENWGDELLRAVILRTDKEDRLVEIVNIGQICKTGHSKLGPIVAVPVVLKRKDGVKVEEKMIIQFRQLGGQSSCVVHGLYGISREIE
jgi:hypothetical protein